MKESFNKLFENNQRRNRLLLVMAVLFSFLTLAYCHLQSPVPGADTESDAKSESSTGHTSKAEIDPDEDGISGELDACPNAAGAAIDNGCPVDSDGDGIADHEDQCPTRTGGIDGCPEDSDGDGIIDEDDTCPHSAGSAANQGCPADSDGDGVGDAVDQCPQTAGQISLDGCRPKPSSADISNHALAADNAAADSKTPDNTPAACNDADSNCSDAPDTESKNIAPLIEPTEMDNGDADGDSVIGEADKCPEQFGDAADNGCPPDSDGDGIADIEDRCPSVAGTISANGCLTMAGNSRVTLEAQDQQILDEALAGVAFDSNSATLTAESSDLLTAVASLLRKYPKATLEIRGHTDASGVADNNMQLSMARARSAAAQIVAAGIDVNRIRAFGYGESQPITSNKSPEGRKINRRVEFDLHFDE